MALLPNTGFYGFLASCKNKLNSFEEWFKSDVAGSGYGWKLWKGSASQEGIYTLETDRVEVRDRIRSMDYDPQEEDRSKRKGFVIETNYSVYGSEEEPTAYSYAEFDEIFVRKRAEFRNVEVEKLRSIGGGILMSAAHGRIVAVYEGTDAYYVVLDDEVGNSDTFFLRGDMALCQRAGFLDDSATFVQKRYWRLVSGAGFTKEIPPEVPEEIRSDFWAQGKRYVMLSKTICEPGSGFPSDGDVILLYGHTGNPSLSSLTDPDQLFRRRRAVMLSQLSSTRAAFVEYQDILDFNLSEKNEVTRICGGSSNKFTGTFKMTSGSITTDFETYITEAEKMPAAIADVLNDPDLKNKILTEAEKATLIANVYDLDQVYVKIESELVIMEENPLVAEGGSLYLKYGAPYFQYADKVKDAIDALKNEIFQTDMQVGLVKTLYDDYLEEYSAYLTRYEAAVNAIRVSEKENYQHTVSDYSVRWDGMTQSVSTYQNKIKVAEAAIKATPGKISFQVTEKIEGSHDKYASAGLSLGVDKTGKFSYIIMDAGKIQIVSKDRDDPDAASLLECMPDQIIARVEGEYSEAGMTISVPEGNEKGSILLYADKVKIFSGKGEEELPSSVLSLTKNEIVQKVRGEYSEAGLSITNEEKNGGRITLQADQVEIRHREKDADGTETVTPVAMFKNGKLNTKLLESTNLFAKGFAQATQPLGSATEITLNLENGFNFAGNPGNANDKYLHLPSGKEYNGVRSTLINTGKTEAGDKSLIVDAVPSGSGAYSSLYTYQDLSQILPDDNSSRDYKIREVAITPGGMLHLYAFWDDTARSRAGELRWLIENLSDYTVIGYDYPEVDLGHTSNALKLIRPIITSVNYTPATGSFSYGDQYYSVPENPGVKDKTNVKSVSITFHKLTNSYYDYRNSEFIITSKSFAAHTNYLVNIIPSQGVEAYLFAQNANSFTVQLLLDSSSPNTCSFLIEHFEYGF